MCSKSSRGSSKAPKRPPYEPEEYTLSVGLMAEIQNSAAFYDLKRLSDLVHVLHRPVEATTHLRLSQ